MLKNHRTSFLVLGFALLVSFLCSGCNTMQGLGEDTERAGEKIQENAR